MMSFKLLDSTENIQWEVINYMYSTYSIMQ